MAISGYKPLRQQETDLEEKLPPYLPCKQPPLRSKAVLASLLALLSTSLSFNTISVYQKLHPQPANLSQTPTDYGENDFPLPLLSLLPSLPFLPPKPPLKPPLAAALLRNVPTSFTIDYSSSHNRTLDDETWNSPSLTPYTGVVALSDTFARAKHLPPAQRFPWDHSKGLYILNGFHNLHCLHLLRTHILSPSPPSYPLSHLSHCLNVIRDDILCNADDTPRYTGRLNAQADAAEPISGIGQKRMCRDWGALRRWAVEHSACYRPVREETKKGWSTLERYKFCPGGEVLWE